MPERLAAVFMHLHLSHFHVEYSIAHDIRNACMVKRQGHAAQSDTCRIMSCLQSCHAVAKPKHNAPTCSQIEHHKLFTIGVMDKRHPHDLI